MPCHGSLPARTRWAARMSSYSIGKASAESRHSRSVRMIGGGWPALTHCRTGAATGAKRSRPAPSTISSVFMLDAAAPAPSRAADPYRSSDTSLGPSALVMSCAKSSRDMRAMSESPAGATAGETAATTEAAESSTAAKATAAESSSAPSAAPAPPPATHQARKPQSATAAQDHQQDDQGDDRAERETLARRKRGRRRHRVLRI